jgi:Fe-S-cluster containining protein
MPEGFCDKCNGKCCTELTIYVTHRDIQRLAKKVGTDPSNFLTLYTDEYKSNYPLVKIQGGEYVIGLTRPREQCVFLMNVGAVNRCGVQDCKPMVCRVYPFNLSKDGLLVHSEPYKCPEKFWPETEEKRQEAIEEIRKFHNEYFEFREVVDTWNSEPKAQHAKLSKFVEFINHL